ncbi:MAG: hypothetical protein LBI05_00380, partial [Planctomycetaceae bacterium]|nr:hypothetical protein [Planctomycetaceae bacterium]
MSHTHLPFRTDQRTADAIIAAAKDHVAQPTDKKVVGVPPAGVTSQYQNTCQFKLTTDWKELSASNFAASGEKFVSSLSGAEQRSFPTTIYAYGERPATNKGSLIVATRRANQWRLLPTGAGGTPSLGKIRLVNLKELFPACEYKSIQNVCGCMLEYSDNGKDWIPYQWFDCIIPDNDVPDIKTCFPAQELAQRYPDVSPKYWRVDLSGNANVDGSGVNTFGRLWEAVFCINRFAKTETEVGGMKFTFSIYIPDWQINTRADVPVFFPNLPSPDGAVLRYRPSSYVEWTEIPADDFSISAYDIQTSADIETGKERYNRSFDFQVVTYRKDEHGHDLVDENGRKIVAVKYGDITIKRPSYKLSPERPQSLTVTERPISKTVGDCTLTATPSVQWVSGKLQMSVDIKINQPAFRTLYYGAEQYAYANDEGEIYETRTIQIPSEDLENHHNGWFMFRVVGVDGSIEVYVPRPSYPVSADYADVALPLPRLDFNVDNMFFNGAPVPRNSDNKRYWTLTFDEPEVVSFIGLEVAYHYEHYILCPGGREESGNARSFIDSFDLVAERWTATTFPQMRTPMYNMDAKICEIGSLSEDEIPFHNLLIMSGQTGNDGAYSGVLQGFTLETGNILDTGSSPLSFAGRPVLWGGWDRQSPDYDDWGRYANQSMDTSFSRHLMVLGGAERSTPIISSTSGVTNGIKYSSILAVEPTSCEVKLVHASGNSGTGVTQITGYAGFGAGQWSVSIAMDTAGSVGNEIKRALKFVRTQNFPVRGFRRKRPVDYNGFPRSSYPVGGDAQVCVDFILIGGFNAYIDRDNDSSVVSAMLGYGWGYGNNTLSTDLKATFHTQNLPAPSTPQNDNYFLTYPDSPVVLGDCCAEYLYYNGKPGYEDRDEIITFGGRLDMNTKSPHEELYVLDFTKTTNRTTPGQYQAKDLEGMWLYPANPAIGNNESPRHAYPDMPHPRYAAASVLIHDFDRNDGLGACDRI